MCDAPGNRHKLTDEEVIDLFVEYLANQGNSRLKVDIRPDKEKHQERKTSPKIDAIAGQFAIEHTSIDSIPKQRGNDALFEQIVKPLEDEFQCKLPFRLVLSIPYDGNAAKALAARICALRVLAFLICAAKNSRTFSAVLGSGAKSGGNAPEILFPIATKSCPISPTPIRGFMNDNVLYHP